MLFIMGITQGRKEFDINQLMTCSLCGAYGSFRVFMTYTVLSLFFIPTLKWGKRYYVDPEVGKRIARGEEVQIRQDDLTRVTNGGRFAKTCRNCGYTTDEDFEYCPKCGNRL